MPLRRIVIGRPAIRNVEEPEVPNAPKVQPQGEVTNTEFREAIRMLSQTATNQVRQQRGDRQEGENTLRIWKFFMMDPPNFSGSRITEDSENGRAEEGV